MEYIKFINLITHFFWSNYVVEGISPIEVADIFIKMHNYKKTIFYSLHELKWPDK